VIVRHYIYICWYIHFHGTKNKETKHIMKSNMFSDNMFWHAFRHLYRQQSPRAFWCVYWHKLWHKFRYVFWHMLTCVLTYISWKTSWHVPGIKSSHDFRHIQYVDIYAPKYSAIKSHIFFSGLVYDIYCILTFILTCSDMTFDVLSGIAVERRPMGHATSASLLWGEEKRRGGRREEWV